MARPSPSIRPANTGSSTSSSGATHPRIGARRTRSAMRDKLHLTKPPDRVISCARISETERVDAFPGRQGEARLEPCPPLRERRRGDEIAGVAIVEPHLDFATRRGGGPMDDLVQVRPQLEVERRGDDIEFDRGDVGEIGVRPDPTRVHDLDQEGRPRPALLGLALENEWQGPRTK